MNKIKLIIAFVALILGVRTIISIWPRDEGEDLTIEQIAQKKVFFQHTIPNAEAKFRLENQQAIERLSQRIDARFQQWEAAIPGFVEDVTDLGSKTKLTGKTLSDMINNLRGEEEKAKAVAEYARHKFEQHLFTADDLNREIQEIARQFGEDLSANRKLFYMELRESWEQHPFTARPFPAEHLVKTTDENLSKFLHKKLAEMQVKSVKGFLASEVIGTATTYIVQQAIVQIGTRMAAGAAGAAAAGAGTAAGGAAAGGAAGAGCGPGCMAIGIGAGFVTGMIVDFFVTKDIQNKMESGLTQMLDDIKTTLIEGDGSQTGLISFYTVLAEQMVAEDANNAKKME